MGKCVSEVMEHSPAIEMYSLTGVLVPVWQDLMEKFIYSVYF